MNFGDIIIFLIVFVTILSYFGVQFINTSKIKSCIKDIEDEESFDKIQSNIDNANKLIKNNILIYIIAYLILSALYFFITYNNGLVISLYTFITLLILYWLYFKVSSDITNDLKLRLYKIYNRINVVCHLGLLIFFNLSFILVFIL